MLAIPIQPQGIKGSHSSVSPIPKSRPVERYIERFIIFAKEGHLDGLQKILKEAGPVKTEILSKLSFHGTTALHEAARSGHCEVMGFLLEYQTIIDSRNGKTGGTPLLAAVASGSEDCINLLLTKGANPDLETRSGLTPRKLAIKKGLDHLFT